jgi:hypothetical protein
MDFGFERGRNALDRFATVRQPDGGTAANGAAGPQNGSPKLSWFAGLNIPQGKS